MVVGGVRLLSTFASPVTVADVVKAQRAGRAGLDPLPLQVRLLSYPKQCMSA
jgi:hypothetical protein